MAYKRLGDLLLGVNLISEDQLNEALALQKGTKKRLGEILIEHKFITEKQLIEALEMQLGLEFVDITTLTIPSNVSSLISKNIAKKHGVVPVRVDRDTLYLATADPLNFVAIEEVRNTTKMRVVPVISTKDAIDRTIARLYGNEGANRAIDEMLEESKKAETVNTSTAVDDDNASAPTIRLVNSIIERAVVERASDIHLEPAEDELVVRMRIDGVMRSMLSVPKNLQSSVISRMKVMGNMDIAEKKVPQDGRANITIKSKDVDLRISTLPTINGEKVVIRLLDKTAQILEAEALGLHGKDLDKFNDLLKAKSGVILIVGPTGSGKSSTMSTMLSKLNKDDVNITTLEDPVEYQMRGVNQVQINEKQGMTFSNGLRAILRQDPDIISVGEIRDGETAEIAMRAAITGHLVLSTVHTSNALAAIDRLLDIGVEPYLIGGAMRGIIAQRLVRRICPNCKESYEATAEEKEALKLNKVSDYVFYKGKGCPMCYNTGYRGRMGVFEILNIDGDLRRQINAGNKKDSLKPNNFVTIEENAIRLVIEGETTPEEAIKVIESSNL
ncbi:MAG: GspE/PulE family protein [Erysipelotrichaceae bacterium]|nr:GspE/PulE family protein [Erysipelotrichaceae bacterium]